MNRQGPGTQQMRLGGYQPGNPQVAAAAAGVRGPTGGLANGKLGAGWQGGPPPGVPTPGSRPNSGLTFSQSLGSQPNTPLDMSEFPALGGQLQTTNVQAWSRISSQSPSQNRQLPSDDYLLGLDDYRIAGGAGTQGQSQQPQGQMQPSSLDDFPALPRTQQNGAHLDERVGYMGGMGGMGGLAAQQQQSRQSLGAGRPMGAPGLGNAPQSRLLPQMESMMPQQGIQMSEVEKKNLMKGNPPSLVPNGAPGLSPSSSTLSQSLPPQSHPSQAPGMPNPGHPPLQQQLPMQAKFPGSTNGVEYGESSPNIAAPTQGAMSDAERFGLGGLLSLIRGDGGDQALALGTDLTQLGLDLNQPDNAPLYTSFASPFMDENSKQVEPEYQLPPCYTVQNVQSLESKIGNFSDETLFYIFYTMPRDLMQELVAAELSQRNWRYHTMLKLWLTKDNSSEIRQISENAEKGVYVFFDPTNWERVRKEYVLEYAYLDHRSTGAGL
ncbi:nuclear-transcribed mRNA catabolic process, deadenylation-dependent decay [Rhizina undulata]